MRQHNSPFLSIFLTAGIATAIILSSCSKPALPLVSTPIVATQTPSVFSEETSIKILPSDVIQQVGSISGFGGSCQQTAISDTVFFCADDSVMEKMRPIYFDVDEPLSAKAPTMTVRLPDGTTEVLLSTYESNFQKIISYNFKYAASLEQPTGYYQFVFETSKGVLDVPPIKIINPDSARLYVDGDLLILYNFSPYEKVRILFYKDSQLNAWQEFIVNENGNRIIRNNYPKIDLSYNDGFVAAGEKSGSIGYLDKGWRLGWALGDVYCSGLPIPTIPHYADHVKTISANAFVESKSGRRILLPVETEIWIYNGPSGLHCKNGNFWYWEAYCKNIKYDGLFCDMDDPFIIPYGTNEEIFLQEIP